MKRKYLAKTKIWIITKAYELFVSTPWGKAYVITAFRKYLESDEYSERSEVFSKKRACEMFLENDESWFFKRKISRREKLGIIFAPYSYIGRAAQTIQEKRLSGLTLFE